MSADIATPPTTPEPSGVSPIRLATNAISERLSRHRHPVRRFVTGESYFSPLPLRLVRHAVASGAETASQAGKIFGSIQSQVDQPATTPDVVRFSQPASSSGHNGAIAEDNLAYHPSPSPQGRVVMHVA